MEYVSFRKTPNTTDVTASQKGTRYAPLRGAARGAGVIAIKMLPRPLLHWASPTI